MKKFINKPENFIDEMLEGLYLAFPEQVCLSLIHISPTITIS